MNEDLSRAIAQATRLLSAKPAISEIWARKILEVLPDNEDARLLLGSALRLQGRLSEARAVFEPLCASPRAPARLFYELGSVLTRQGEWGAAEACHRELVARFPEDARAWLLLGHTLKARGKADDCIAAYRQAMALAPGLGEATWSLANLKTVPFEAGEIAAMTAELARADLAREDRVHFAFALAKALEDGGDYAASFAHYTQGNALQRASRPYNAERTHDFVERLKAAFSRDFFAARPGAGFAAPDPIFIVGLPRSGSTLVEQMLASHSAVEGTAELRDVAEMARALGDWEYKNDGSAYPELLAGLPLERFRALGEAYLARTRVHRKTQRPFFIDKMPNNFLHAGFIHAMLPNAKIVDVRRHPLACGLSCFKQHFAHGFGASCSLTDIGRYYADYADLMAHFDSVLPGRVHRVYYERLIADPESEIRRLLAYCGLPFEESCLEFHLNPRAVATASSEQVRQPMSREGLEHWRAFEPWLGPLKDALGPQLDAYPEA
jgi:tetratricopeptide (TPR) repeat protein